MKNFNWLKEIYGSKEDGNKREVFGGFLFLALGSLVLILTISFDVDIISKVAMLYGIAVFVSSAIFSFCSYCFTNGSKKDRHKIGKYILFIGSLLLVVLVFLPVIFVAFVSKKIKFEAFIAHFEKYIVATCIPFLFATIVGLHLFIELQNVTWLNSATVSMMVAFVLWRASSMGILKLYHIFSKKYFSIETYHAIKKDLFVIVFAMITLVTIIANCLALKNISKELVEGITKAFAIYIACDRLQGKWEKVNKEYQREIVGKTESRKDNA